MASHPPAVVEDRTLAEELTGRLLADPTPRAASVTDLLDSRRAYWRRVAGPAPVAPARRARMDSGRLFHRAIDRALPREGAYEVRLRRGGVSARIDLLAEVPVEIKSGDEPPPDDLVEGRPEYLEQVAMYCALLERGEGRLVHVHPTGNGGVGVRAVDVAFGDVAALRREVAARASALRSAVTAKDGAGLARCRWFAMGCEFRAAGICDCRGTEPEPSSGFLDEVVALVVRGDVEERWATALASVGGAPTEPAVRKYRDLVYPRRAFFEAEEPRTPTSRKEGPTVEHPPSEVYDSSVGALEGGPVGTVRRLPEVGEAPGEEVAGWNGRPYIIRTSRAWSRIKVEEVLGRFPQYALELGFRCVTTGTSQGHVVVAYERTDDLRARFQVLSYDFGSTLEAYRAEYEARRTALAAARAAHEPKDLVPCAGWMTTDCPYRERCGCAEELARSQR